MLKTILKGVLAGVTGLLTVALIVGVGGAAYLAGPPATESYQNAASAPVVVKNHHDSRIVMVMNGEGHGTGFVVARNMILTNAHVVDDKTKVKVQTVANKVLNGTIVKVDKARDLALVFVKELKATSVVLDTQPVTNGDRVYVVGHGGKSWYSRVDGTVSHYYYFNRPDTGLNITTVIASAPVIGGHSGSPVFTSTGTVAGIVSMGDGANCYFVPTSEIFKFLKQFENMTITITKPVEE